jgi:hypothetical protein
MSSCKIDGGYWNPSPPFRGEREGPIAARREGEVGVNRTAGVSPACRPEAGGPSGTPHLTPTFSAPSPHPSLPRKRGRVREGALSAPAGAEGVRR